MSSLSSTFSRNSRKSFDEKSFDDITLIKKISKAKFSVFLGFSPSHEQHYAVKVFPYRNGKPQPYFINEARFSIMSHPNIIDIVYIERERDGAFQNGLATKISYLIMELAPFGDLYDIVMNSKIAFDDLLTRTFFHHLIQGLEFLHTEGAAHLDLKLENLLLGKDLNLKITDFDLSFLEGDEPTQGIGTRYYRAPELRAKACTDYYAADIYSAGIILFVLKSKGTLPHLEDTCFEGLNFFELLNKDPETFFQTHTEIQGVEQSFYDPDFRELFLSMVNLDPKKRATISQIKKSKWFKGPILGREQLSKTLSPLIEKLEKQQNK